MPTGNGGGHFGGGSHSGGGHSGGGHFESGGFGSRRKGMRLGRPVFIYTFGSRRYYIGEKRNSLLSTLMLFLFIAIVVIISKVGNYFEAKDKVQIIENDFATYNAIIDDALQDASKIVEGTYVGRDFRYDKWCIKYKFAYNGRTYNGYSFYVYSADECTQIANQEEFQIAVGNLTSSGEPNSIEMNFRGKTLDDDGEYNYYSSRVGSQKTWIIISSVTAGGIIVSMIVISAISFKKDTQKDEDNERKIFENKKETGKYCAYCGSELGEDETSCPNCGAEKGKK